MSLSTNTLRLFFSSARGVTDQCTQAYYRQEKWRSWKFRIYCHRNSSEDKLFNAMEKAYGADCTIFYGNWSRREQMPGCNPSPTTGIRKRLGRRFHVVVVDEFRSSKVCNECHQELCTYNKLKKRRLSRLPCESEKCTSICFCFQILFEVVVIVSLGGVFRECQLRCLYSWILLAFFFLKLLVFR